MTTVSSAISPDASKDISNGGVPPQSEPTPEVIRTVDPLVSPKATDEQKQKAYDIGTQVSESSGNVTQEELTQATAQAIVKDGTIPVNVSEVAPLVPPGTALGPFASADEAAVEMMNYSNPLSIQANLENGGKIFRNDSGQFYVTTPMGGTLDGFNPGQVPDPAGMDLVAVYHGHADYSLADGTRTTKEHDQFNSDHFSSQDKSLADRGIWGDIIYVSTPSGDFRKYDGNTKQDTIIN